VKELDYESSAKEPARPRPVWVWIIVVIYLILAAAIVLAPLWVMIFGDVDMLMAASVSACVLTLCGLGLLITPVKLTHRRTITRRNIWIPILTSGFLVGALVFGAGIALEEYFLYDRDYVNMNSRDMAYRQFLTHETVWKYGVLIAGVGVWLFWWLVFMLANAANPSNLAVRFHHWILAGSVAELLVAVPTHIVVRRRTVCCAGIMTGTAICIGVAVMIVAFGPSVYLLYRRRWKQIRND
jgi:hypothetical protein